ncbi:TIR domain-containing protein [Clostridium saccharobutylicum]|uniref:Putative nucleotide-binding protein containing TIR-like domain protein n=1 Tax=Clostridium saccharobutylicum TaxID=169679 RepID=A0A1S8NDP8_CLOSA|nr:TIR domain-containing protein [Clostridium saccharobutylicum]OOM14502.1 putative nucleotide-binding protein containing TIR-like domain protein [Clostridium saccharobutylicum]
MIDVKEIKRILENRDSANILCREFELKPKNIAMYIASMANTMEGYIVIGAIKEQKSYKLINISRTFNFNGVIEAAKKQFLIQPEIEYKLLNIERKNVFVIKVYKSYKEIFCDNKLYMIENNEVVKVEGERIMDKTKVFIVHGHDNEAKQETARFIEKLGLQAIILHEQANKGQTIIEKIEENSNVGFAVVLYTPCDEGRAKNQPELKDRARQNVIFEHGYLIGKIGRKNVCALVKGDVEKPNDISGVVYINMDSHGAWKMDLFKEMKESGYSIDASKFL